MKRIVQAEWLDSLPPNDPDAIGSRRDLVRLNRIMGNARIMGDALQETMNGNTHLTELGAGDGHFLLSLARQISAQKPVMSVTLLDRQEAVSVETHNVFASLGWNTQVVRSDVFDWLHTGGMDGTMIANLFLHHFRADQLAELFGLIARRVDLFIALEPRRAAWPLFCSRLLWGIGCNHVTRHDAVVSVQAGFTGNELTLLWPRAAHWQIVERSAGAFGHFFMAQKLH